MTSQNCSKCMNPLDSNDKFCPGCGAPVQEASSETRHIRSTGTYSGKMTQSGTGFFKRLLYIILGVVLLGGGAILVWMLIDPDAGKKLKNLLDYLGAGIVILIFFWVFFTGKRKRRSGSNRDDYDGHHDGDDDFGGDDD